MATAKNTPFDRFNDALRGLDDQLQEVRERFEDGRKRVESELKKRVEQGDSRVRDTDLFKRAEKARAELEDGVDQARTKVLETLGIASRSEIVKLDQKLDRIQKKLKKLAKEREEAAPEAEAV